MATAPALHDLACVIHLHSTYSDGTGTVPEIAAAARRSGVDVVLLTDHDTLEARRRGEERWHDGVLVLVGEEVTPRDRNHFLAFGIDREISPRMDGAQICETVRLVGGFGFAAHPFSQGSPRFKRAAGMPFADLDCDALEGLELWSFVTDTAEALPSIKAALGFVIAPGRVVDHPPERNLREWDRLCRTRRVVAIGGLDAHQFGKRVRGHVPLKLMSYKRSFRTLRTHVLLQSPLTRSLEEDRGAVYGALREGRCYLAMDSVAPARGFSFWGEDPDGSVALMGAEAQAGRWNLCATAPRPARLRVVRDGAVVSEVSGDSVELLAEGKGVYRVEAYLRRHGRDRTWILSNPIYLR